MTTERPTSLGVTAISSFGALAETRAFLKALARKPLGVLGAVLVLFVLVVGVLAPVIAPYSPTELHVSNRLMAPTLSHPLGTDALGRDVLSRLIFGAQNSLTVSFISVVTGTIFGAAFGVLSGYFRGPFDFLFQRLMDMMQSFPLLIMAMVIVALLGASTKNVIIAIAIVIIPGYNRVARGATLAVRNYDYITAVRALGASHLRVMMRHILPNISAPIVVLATASFGGAILVQASLTFLGLGASPTEPTWGGMLSVEGRRYWEQAPWLALFPGIAISLAVYGYNLLGDALRDIWDPTMRGQ